MQAAAACYAAVRVAAFSRWLSLAAVLPGLAEVLLGALLRESQPGQLIILDATCIHTFRGTRLSYKAAKQLLCVCRQQVGMDWAVLPQFAAALASTWSAARGTSCTCIIEGGSPSAAVLQLLGKQLERCGPANLCPAVPPCVASCWFTAALSALAGILAGLAAGLLLARPHRWACPRRDHVQLHDQELSALASPQQQQQQQDSRVIVTPATLRLRDGNVGR